MPEEASVGLNASPSASTGCAAPLHFPRRPCHPCCASPPASAFRPLQPPIRPGGASTRPSPPRHPRPSQSARSARCSTGWAASPPAPSPAPAPICGGPWSRRGRGGWCRPTCWWRSARAGACARCRDAESSRNPELSSGACLTGALWWHQRNQSETQPFIIHNAGCCRRGPPQRPLPSCAEDQPHQSSRHPRISTLKFF